MGKERGQGTGARGQEDSPEQQRPGGSGQWPVASAQEETEGGHGNNPEQGGRGQRAEGSGEDLRAVIREVMGEFMSAQKKTESLEKRVNELVAEAAEARRSASVRAELQRLGVVKIDLAYKAVKDDVRGIEGDGALKDFLEGFVIENPELLPARMTGGSGASSGQRGSGREGVDLSQIRAGMSAEEMDRVRREVARVAAQTLKGQ